MKYGWIAQAYNQSAYMTQLSYRGVQEKFAINSVPYNNTKH